MFAGVFVLIILIPSVAVKRQTASFVFTSFNAPTDLNLPSDPYVFLLGLLMSQYSLAGFDASAHMVTPILSFRQGGDLLTKSPSRTVSE